jgi:hypothetical protein
MNRYILTMNRIGYVLLTITIAVLAEVIYNKFDVFFIFWIFTNLPTICRIRVIASSAPSYYWADKKFRAFKEKCIYFLRNIYIFRIRDNYLRDLSAAWFWVLERQANGINHHKLAYVLLARIHRDEFR